MSDIDDAPSGDDDDWSETDEPHPAADVVYGRVNVEFRLLATLSVLWAATLVQSGAWMWIYIEPDRLEQLPWSTLAGLQILGLLLLLGAVFAKLPLVRWPRRGSHTRLPSPIPLGILGAPALLFLPLLAARNQRAARQPPSTEVELAFRELLSVPQTAGLSALLWLGLASVGDAIVITNSLSSPPLVTVAICTLALASVAPYAAIAVSRARAILRPEYLTAPRPNPQAFSEQRNLRIRLGGPAALAGFGAALAPLLAGFAWHATALKTVQLEEAKTAALELVDLAEKGDVDGLGRHFAERSGATLWIDSRRYGKPIEAKPTTTGKLDVDGDNRFERYVVARGPTIASVPIVPAGTIDPWVLFLGGLAALSACFGALAFITRDVARDVVRATKQVEAVANGTIPEPVSETSFSTSELRQLVLSVDRLVSRISETNVAKYVVIERAQEADRLKSQFLANMSHDLRSPLNSILGFSELLLTGLEGEISEGQREMITLVHRSGRTLLQQIDDILDTAKLDAGRMELHPEPAPPATLVSKATQAARKRLDRDLQFETVSAAGLPPAFVDPYRTTQAIENVLVFAGERVEPGERIHVELRPKLVDDTRFIEILVETPTQPATADQLEAALRGFVRMPGHTGLGLGLPIAGAVLELQGGSLQIEEADGTWESRTRSFDAMRFTILLPAPEARIKLRLRER